MLGKLPPIVADLVGQPLGFGRDGSLPYTSNLELLLDGAIRGYGHPNEARWCVDDGHLALCRADGSITTHFTEVIENSRAHIVLRGLSRTSLSLSEPIFHVIAGRGGSSILRQLLIELYSWNDPFHAAQLKYLDQGYPHSSLRSVTELVGAVLRVVQPTFWLEIGSMLGGSAIVTAELVKRLEIRCGIVALDPFCGDVNMWAWEREHRQNGQWQFLRLEDGQPSIYRRFLANVLAAGHQDVILPISTTSTVGLKLLRRLYTERRISELPSVIYLDSAHEPDETFLEIRNAWELLPPGGVLMGDDWDWEAVRADVKRFAQDILQNPISEVALRGFIPEIQTQDNVLIYKKQWLLTK